MMSCTSVNLLLLSAAKDVRQHWCRQHVKKTRVCSMWSANGLCVIFVRHQDHLLFTCTLIWLLYQRDDNYFYCYFTHQVISFKEKNKIEDGAKKHEEKRQGLQLKEALCDIQLGANWWWIYLCVFEWWSWADSGKMIWRRQRKSKRRRRRRH